MAYVYQSVSAAATGSTSASPTIPAVVAGDLILLSVSSHNAFVSTPSGWSVAASNNSGPVFDGTVLTYVFWKIATGSEGGTTVTATATGAQEVIASVTTYHPTDPNAIPEFAGYSVGGNTTTGSILSVSGASGHMSQSDTWLVTHSHLTAVSVTWASQALTATSNSLSPLTERIDTSHDLAGGDRLHQNIVTARRSTTGQSASTTLTYATTPSNSAALTTNAGGYSISVLRIREIPRVSMRSHGAVVNGTTSVAVAYPATIFNSSGVAFAAGDKFYLRVASKYGVPDAAPVGWTQIAQSTSAAGTADADTGVVTTTIFTKIATGSESGTVTVNFTGGNVCIGRMYCLTRNASNLLWEESVTTASISGAGTAAFNATLTGLSYQPGDLMMFFLSLNADTGIVTGITVAATSTPSLATLNNTWTENVSFGASTTNGNDAAYFDQSVFADTTGLTTPSSLVAQYTNGASFAAARRAAVVHINVRATPISGSGGGAVSSLAGSGTAVQQQVFAATGTASPSSLTANRPFSTPQTIFGADLKAFYSEGLTATSWTNTQGGTNLTSPSTGAVVSSTPGGYKVSETTVRGYAGAGPADVAAASAIVFFVFRSYGGTNQELVHWTNGTASEMYINGGTIVVSCGPAFSTPLVYNDNKWHTAILRMQVGGRTQLFVDGIRTNDVAAGARTTFATWSSSINIGQIPGGTAPFGGRIGAVGFVARVGTFTESDVASLEDYLEYVIIGLNLAAEVFSANGTAARLAPTSAGNAQQRFAATGTAARLAPLAQGNAEQRFSASGSAARLAPLAQGNVTVVLSYDGAGGAAFTPLAALGSAEERFAATGTAAALIAALGVAEERFSGAGNGALQPLAGAGQAQERFAATGTSSPSSLAGSGQAVESFSASGLGACSSASASGSASEVFLATGSATCSSIGGSGVGVYTAPPITSSGAATCSPLAGAGAAQERFQATGTGASSSLSGSGVGSYVPQAISGTGTSACASLAGAGSCVERFIGSGVSAPSPLASNGSAAETFSSTGTGTAQPLAANAVGTYTPLAIAGTGSAACSPLAGAGTAQERFSSVGTASCASFGASGSGTYTAEAITSTGSAAVTPLSATCVGVQAFRASGSAALSSLGATGSGTYTPLGITGTGSAACAPLNAAGIAQERFAAAGTGVCSSAAGSGAAAYTPPARTAAGSSQLTSFSAAGTCSLGFTASGTAIPASIGASAVGTYTPLGITSSGSAVASSLACSGVVAQRFAAAGLAQTASMAAFGSALYSPPGVTGAGSAGLVIEAYGEAEEVFFAAGAAAVRSMVPDLDGYYTASGIAGFGQALIATLQGAGFSPPQHFIGEGEAELAIDPDGNVVEVFSAAGVAGAARAAATGLAASAFSSAGTAGLSPLAAAGLATYTYAHSAAGAAALGLLAGLGAALETFQALGSAAMRAGALGDAGGRYTGVGAAAMQIGASGAAGERFIGAGTAALRTMTALGTGVYAVNLVGAGTGALSPIAGTGSAFERFVAAANAELPRPAALGVAVEVFQGSAVGTIASMAGSGGVFQVVHITGTGLAMVVPLAALGSAKDLFTGVGAASFARAAADGTASFGVSAGGSAGLMPVLAEGFSELRFDAVGTAEASSLEASGAGYYTAQAIIGSGDAALRSLRALGQGTFIALYPEEAGVKITAPYKKAPPVNVKVRFEPAPTLRITSSPIKKK